MLEVARFFGALSVVCRSERSASSKAFPCVLHDHVGIYGFDETALPAATMPRGKIGCFLRGRSSIKLSHSLTGALCKPKDRRMRLSR